ncbi:MAG: hypothetical protein GY913_06305 [Proteobacteria bacterium]|nr:hypothetical protein [Pseudomonadota bacterium]MCP4916519.1 hypothetical protein [Pseudomonadota bacterium]
MSWSNEGDGVAITKTGAVDCYLLDYDQGWDVEACIDPNPSASDDSESALAPDAAVS